MSDCALLTPLSRSSQSPRRTLSLYQFSPRTRKLGFPRSLLKARSCSKSSNPDISIQIVRGASERNEEVNWSFGLNPRRFGDHSRSSYFGNLDWFSDRRGGNQSLRGSLKKTRGERDFLKFNCVKRDWSSGIPEILDEDFELERRSRGEVEDACLDPAPALDAEEKVLGRKLAEFGHREKENNPNRDSSLSSTFDLLELKGELQKAEEIMSSSTQEGSDLVPGEGSQRSDGESKSGELVGGPDLRRKELLRRSTMLAKQVISMQSALSLGFVSQLWVDTRSVSVVFPNLVSIFFVANCISLT